MCDCALRDRALCAQIATMLLRMFALCAPVLCVLVACVCALRAGALCLCRDLPMHPFLSLVPLAAIANIALFDDIVRLGVDASTWLIANYIMCGIGDGA